MKKIGFYTMFAAALLGCTALSAADAEEGLVLHLPLNEGEGEVVKDLGPRQLTGKVVQPADTKWVEGRSGGKALEMSGVNGKAPYIEVRGFKPDDFTRGMTVMCYFKPDKEKYVRKAVWQLVCDGTRANFLMAVHYQRLIFGNDNKFTKHAVSNNGKNPVRGGEWIHLAATHDGQTFKVYIDGALAGVGGENMSGPIAPGRGTLAIGSRFGWGPAFGVFSDVKLYTRALSDAEIMNAASGEN